MNKKKIHLEKITQRMSLHISSTFLKLASVVLLSTTTTFAVKYFKAKKENLQLKESIKLEKETYVNDLKEIFKRYDTQILKNKELSESKKDEAFIQKVEIHKKKDGLSNESFGLVYFKKNDSKKQIIDSFQNIIREKEEENKTIHDEMDRLSQKNTELENKNRENEKIVSKTRNLTATNVIANGVKIVSNNIIETKRFSATEQIKVCFTLLENKAAVQGYKDIYLQIINPKKKVVTNNGDFVEYGNQLLRYSAKTNVFYENEELDVCVFIDPNKKDLLPGDYEINIYSGINLIGNTVFSLK